MSKKKAGVIIVPFDEENGLDFGESNNPEFVRIRIES